jgi:hypothetical protein
MMSFSFMAPKTCLANAAVPEVQLSTPSRCGAPSKLRRAAFEQEIDAAGEILQLVGPELRSSSITSGAARCIFTTRTGKILIWMPFGGADRGTECEVGGGSRQNSAIPARFSASLMACLVDAVIPDPSAGVPCRCRIRRGSSRGRSDALAQRRGGTVAVVDGEVPLGWMVTWWDTVS